MIRRSLKDLSEMCQGSLSKEGYENIFIEGVSTDSRNLKKDQLFIPLAGENFNGHDFIGKAIERGASAVLWNKEEPLPDIDFPFLLVDDTLGALQKLAKEYRCQLDVKIIGITGSNGKTSTKDILASILATKYKTKKTMGNLNNHIGAPLTLLSLDEDTEMAVVEMGADNFGEIALLTDIAKPDVAIITNIGEAHLESFLTRENIARAKLEILKGLPSDGLFIYFGDEPLLKEQIKTMNIEQEIFTYGTEDFNDYICELDKLEQDRLSFSLKSSICQNFLLPMLGEHNMYNAAAAIIAARYFNIPLESIQEGLYQIEKTGMRNELVYAEGFTILNDSYNSNPGSVLAALDTLYSMDRYQQKIVVLGDMLGLGEGTIQMHEEIGMNIDPEQVQYLFTIGSLAKYIGTAARINFGKDKILACSSKEQLVKQLEKVIKSNSLVLVKASRSLELEDVVDSLKKDVLIPKNELL